MIRKTLTSFLLFAFALAAFAGGKAKYVFYFIGDGMGVNQVNAAMTYLAACEGRIGIQKLCFTQFPCATIATTYSATNGVTDSAASGTALATGQKTFNGSLGVAADHQTPINSVAYAAQQAGAAVGITTSVSVDHATPAAFYAHQASRSSYYAVGEDLIRANYDFYAGSDFLQPHKKNSPSTPSLYDQCREAGYTLTHGLPDYQQNGRKADKVIMLQTDAANRRDHSALPYAIDRTDADLTLSQITQSAIDFLYAKKKKGFFLMVEGGKIDWACHANDAGTMVKEVIDLDEAVQRAYAFYRQHPKETLIVVTADHETGGLALGRGPYELHTDVLSAQRMSTEAYSRHIKQLHKEQADSLTWDQLKADLRQYWGLGAQVKITESQEARLHAAFDAMKSGQSTDKKTLYAQTDAFADVARQIMAEAALLGWQSGGHSNGFVPVFAIGQGAERFHQMTDNAEIPLQIAKAAGWTMQ